MSASTPAARPTGVEREASRIRFRRAVTLLLMNLVAPGSAQIAAGNKRVGRWAMRAFGVALLCTLLLLLVAVVSRDEIITLFTNVWFLGVLRFALIGYAVFWAFLLIDAWRIANPLGLRQSQRLAMTALNGIVCLSLTGGLLYASQVVAAERGFISAVFTHHHVDAAQDGRYNVLLLGGDEGFGRVGLRPDSMTLASVDEKTGRTVLFGLPRNMADVPFPTGSVMAKQFPKGFDCAAECYLNAVYTWATEHASLFPGVSDPGIFATEQAIEQITGLHINYYVLVDLNGFSKLVDALGGITVDVHQEVPIGGVGGPISGYIHPGLQRLNGYETLWYSRSRAWSSDYSRMARQKCVMNAMLHEMSPETVLTKFTSIANVGKTILTTSIPASQISTFVDLALKARSLPVTTVSFVPPTIDTGNPNWTLIRHLVSTALAASEKAGTSHAAGHPTKAPSDLGDKDSYQTSYAANDTSDLSGTC
jgi:LCP family protein required for cell wall assembly